MNKSPTRPKVPDVRPLLTEYYAKPDNATGGCFHIVFEDGNYTDADIQHCIDRSHFVGDTDGVKLGELLIQMTRTQRSKLTTYR